MGHIRSERLFDWAIALLILEGIPFLALVYYLGHKRRMYLLEKGITEPDRSFLRDERRLFNGIFLILAGASMILAPGIARAFGMDVQLSFELLLAGLVVLCSGGSLILGSLILKCRDEGRPVRKML
jgi:cyanate permease